MTSAILTHFVTLTLTMVQDDLTRAMGFHKQWCCCCYFWLRNLCSCYTLYIVFCDHFYCAVVVKYEQSHWLSMQDNVIQLPLTVTSDFDNNNKAIGKHPRDGCWSAAWSAVCSVWLPFKVWMSSTWWWIYSPLSASINSFVYSINWYHKCLLHKVYKHKVYTFYSTTCEHTSAYTFCHRK